MRLSLSVSLAVLAATLLLLWLHAWFMLMTVSSAQPSFASQVLSASARPASAVNAVPTTSASASVGTLSARGATDAFLAWSERLGLPHPAGGAQFFQDEAVYKLVTNCARNYGIDCVVLIAFLRFLFSGFRWRASGQLGWPNVC